jgi:virulence-associated protein VapD
MFLKADDDHFATQTQVYNDIGEEMLQHAFEGLQKKKSIKLSIVQLSFIVDSINKLIG